MSAFRLAHISDLHLPPPSDSGAGAGLSLKRALSRLAWRRKRRRHSLEALDQVVEDLKAQAPDHIAITGDLTNFASAEEFAAARAWLERLASPADVTVSPGNHDALVGAGDDDRFAVWRPWLGDGEGASFPQLRRRGPLALVNLCSAVPTAIHLARGALGSAQRERLRLMLRDLGRQGLCRVLLIHHPPTPGVVSGRKALTDAPDLMQVLREEGAELVLHGHAHVAGMTAAPGPVSQIPVLGVPSASAVLRGEEGARWHCLEITGSDGAWSIRVAARGLVENGEIADLGSYVLNQLTWRSASSR